ncbi:MAG: hypothetical protein Q8S14_11070 [Algoriphagus sp.]|uniref:hypothetical protein n=1 Tax=Algoriphagus sp. TaxID=1872435 RepID=UPI00272F3A0D|nr:hypothetical protein [Algoriphagus sp.]MDP2042535.1 hypothetical protein [Algoriphagus sp.]MDP3472404.1 hypothetical protein [Algoriphagus sp.]
MKRNKLIFYLIGAVVLIILFQIVSSSLSQPGLQQFEGKYEEIGFYRNENNTGPVLRIYAIRVLDSDLAWMKEFADAQPHTKYGKTLVFFFSDQLNQKVELSPQEPYFSQDFREFLLAAYEKTPMGESRFQYSSQ